MGLFDFLFSSPESTTVTKSQLPTWYENYLKSLTAGAGTIANAPYQTYGGPRIAPLNPDQLASFDVTRAGIGGFDPYAEQAGSMIQSAGGPFDQGEFDAYMSPYTEGVVNRIADLGARNLSEKLLPQVNTTFTGAGQFGSSRHADFTGKAVRDTQESILGQQATALQSAYDAAMQNYGAGMDRRLTAGTQYAGLGGQAQGANLKDAAALEAIGATQQGQTQSNLDLAYQDFLRQQNYPKEQAGFMSGILTGQPYSSTTTSTGPGPGGSPLGQLGGLATGAAGILGATGAFGPTGWLFKKGGPVRGIGGQRTLSRRVAKGKRAPSKQPMPMAGIGGMGGGPMMMGMR